MITKPFRLVLIFAFAGFVLPVGADAGNKAIIVTYNVLADPIYKKQRIPELLKILGESNADIIALQEVAPWFIEEVGKAEWFKSYYVPIEANEIVNPRGLLILSREPVTQIEYDLLPGNQMRAYLIVSTTIKGHNFKVATCHLESPLDAGETRARQLDVLFEKLADAEHVLLSGDFNFGDHEQPETAHLSDEYYDLWSKTNKWKKGYTWNIKKSKMAWNGSFRNEISRRIDRILIKSDKTIPVKSKIIGDRPLDKRKVVFPSDHFGLYGTVTIDDSDSY